MSHHHEIEAGARGRAGAPEALTQQAPCAVSGDRSAYTTAHGEAQAVLPRAVRRIDDEKQPPAHAGAALEDPVEQGGARESPAAPVARPHACALLGPKARPGQAAIRLRPFWRRRFRTSWPPFVRMRTRNPCVRLRCRLFGWNVLFIG
jgi:hypothetical protein